MAGGDGGNFGVGAAQDPPPSPRTLWNSRRTLTEHSERDSLRRVTAIPAPDLALEGTGVIPADGRELQGRE